MSVRTLTLLALLIALTTVATMIVQIPIPATQGYINVGDAMVFTSALLFDPAAGLLAGGVGSALADWFSGYQQFAPYTLVIKGLEGLIAGLIAWGLLKGRPRATAVGIASTIAAMVIGGAVMVGGYYAVEQFIMGKAAAAEVPGNLFQVLAGVVIATPVTLILRSVAPTLRAPSSQ